MTPVRKTRHLVFVLLGLMSKSAQNSCRSVQTRLTKNEGSLINCQITNNSNKSANNPRYNICTCITRGYLGHNLSLRAAGRGQLDHSTLQPLTFKLFTPHLRVPLCLGRCDHWRLTSPLFPRIRDQLFPYRVPPPLTSQKRIHKRFALIASTQVSPDKTVYNLYATIICIFKKLDNGL